MRFITYLMLILVYIAPAYGQITLTGQDLFVLGDSYTALANVTGSLIDVSGVIGEPGENAWDFTSFDNLALRTLTFDYVETTTGGFGGELLFPTAEFAQQTTEETQGPEAQRTILEYVYLSQNSTGRRIHGLYIPIFLDQPEEIYTPELLSLPLPLTFGQTWVTETTFDDVLNVFGILIETRNVLRTDAVVDGFGTITLPELGTLNGLRVQELRSREVAIDIFGAGVFMPLDTIVSRTYIWYAEGAGEIARITSEFHTTTRPPIGEPPVNFTTASILQIQIANSKSEAVPLRPAR